jgi:uncharacterized phiE125 gp8 family phage protein
MSLKLVTGPKASPIDLDDVKDDLRIDGTDDDSMLQLWVDAATDIVEKGTGRALITQTWELRLDHFPFSGPIWIPTLPLQSVTSVKYIDPDGVEQTMSSSNYEVDFTDDYGKIVLAYGESWPSIRDKINAVTVRFVAGYGDAAAKVHPGIRKLIGFLLTHWYENREPVVVGTIATEVPQTLKDLIWSFKTFDVKQL